MAKKKVYPPNELIFRQYIERAKPESINPQWVYWMLAMLYDARKKKAQINPEFLKAHPGLQSGEPLMELGNN